VPEAVGCISPAEAEANYHWQLSSLTIPALLTPTGLHEPGAIHTEALASLVKLRANTLLTGVQAMLNDPKFSGLAQKVSRSPRSTPQTSWPPLSLLA
jgi:hypothetical protein